MESHSESHLVVSKKQFIYINELLFTKILHEFHICLGCRYTLKSTYNEVTFNEKLAITKENPHTKYTPFTYKDIALNEKPPIMKHNLHIFFSL